jgi:hypothetical protein
MPLVRHLREAGTGGEYMSAVTLILLGSARILDPNARSSLVLYLLSLRFPGLWLSLVFLIGAVHLIALCLRPTFRRIVVRKACSVVGQVIFLGLTIQVILSGNIGAVIWLGQIVVYLTFAIQRPRITYLLL